MELSPMTNTLLSESNLAHRYTQEVLVCLLFVVLMFLSMFLILNFRTLIMPHFKHCHLCCAMNA